MTLHPELVAACKAPDLTMKKLVKVLQKHASLSKGTHFEDGQWPKDRGADHTDKLFWDSCIPLSELESPLGNLSEHDPIIRSYPSIREGLINWLCNPDRSSNINVIFHPFYGIGENRGIVNAVSRVFLDIHRLGGVVSGHYHHGRNKWEWVEGLCHFLADRYPLYRQALARRVAEDLGIFMREIAGPTLLKKLVLEPWEELAARSSLYSTRPPVVILTHKDRWKLAEILETVKRADLKPQLPALLWLVIVSSSPVSPLSLPMNSNEVDSPDVTPLQFYQHTKLSVGTCEADKMSYLALQARIRIVLRFYRPLDIDIWRLARAISGVPIFLNVLVRFLHYRVNENPLRRLERCLTYISRSPKPTNDSPYLTAVHFLRHALADTPLDLRSPAFRILECLYIHRYDANITTPRMENLLGIEKEVIIRVLKHLEWIIEAVYGFIGSTYLPKSLVLGSSKELYILESGSQHFFSEAERLGHPLLVGSRFSTMQSYFRILSLPPFQSLVPVFQTLEREGPDWVIARMIGHGLADLSYAWDLGQEEVNQKEQEKIKGEIGQFDFTRLVNLSRHISRLSFFQFLKWLSEFNKDQLVRTRAISAHDEELLRKCAGVAEPLDLFTDTTPYSYFLHPKYALLGHDTRTILVLLYTTQEALSSEIFTEWKEGVAIYSYQMLDEL
ncbi:hypothetical protein NP233_g11397 [Leucocoprinus birnbaumii]|uniref:Uncharacterized protein n=1 Tax=Leucocoprinus birnbaumii TaxID=56174 RepID=A0AAD5YQZ9_9AGAR|nr:hypothetical protein NP233_g11397 [Leucocoprinus birnbaumii]